MTSCLDAAISAAAAPLAGLRVLDLSTMIAAPLTASLLADHGAQVVKVEQPGEGDPVRRFGPRLHGEGLFWKTLSRGKETVALDLRRPASQRLLARWIPQFDVVVENFRPGTLARWNLDPAELCARSPSLTVLQVTAYGQTGPYRSRAGFGTLAEAMTGIVAATATDERPRVLPYPLADVMAGHLGAIAVLAAVRRRDRTGRGTIIDPAIYEAALKLIEMDLLECSVAGRDGLENASLPNAASPRGTYRCGDGGWLALAASTQAVAERVLTAVGGADFAADPRFATNVGRLAHGDELDAVISRWCAARGRDEAEAELSLLGCAVGPVETVETMLRNPQVQARGSVSWVRDEALGEIAVPSVSPRFGDEPRPVPRLGPAQVGADTKHVLARDLGMTPREIAEFL